jgi:hypothetical protein
MRACATDFSSCRLLPPWSISGARQAIGWSFGGHAACRYTWRQSASAPRHGSQTAAARPVPMAGDGLGVVKRRSKSARERLGPARRRTPGSAYDLIPEDHFAECYRG